MNILAATRSYEAWLGKYTSLVRYQINTKHQLMARDPMRFLRGSFFRWSQLWPEVCPQLAKATPVLAVGDFHISSFGTWRDAFGRLAWGVDDFDEAYRLAYANDLVRLAVSAALDASEDHLAAGAREICDVVLDGYTEGLKAGGQPFLLEEKHKWLRQIALDRLDAPRPFWRKMDTLPAVRHNAPRQVRDALHKHLPEPHLDYRVVRREAGIGSLGHPRYVAIANWHGGQIAIEAKELVPSACAWANPSGTKQIQYQNILDRAIRAPDPLVRLEGHWIIRRLAPDSSAFEIETMSGRRRQDRLLHAMAREAANVHAGTPGAVRRILIDLKRRPGKWLHSAVKDMSKAIIRDWKEWRKTYR
ncbi:MAG TPA: DUF2252 family protein [Bryobacteraceae bacterium]|nr:DUF2252 family protein [Bryobacteraceae bacterium]